MNKVSKLMSIKHVLLLRQLGYFCSDFFCFSFSLQCGRINEANRLLCPCVLRKAVISQLLDTRSFHSLLTRVFAVIFLCFSCSCINSMLAFSSPAGSPPSVHPDHPSPAVPQQQEWMPAFTTRRNRSRSSSHVPAAVLTLIAAAVSAYLVLQCARHLAEPMTRKLAGQVNTPENITQFKRTPDLVHNSRLSGAD